MISVSRSDPARMDGTVLLCCILLDLSFFCGRKNQTVLQDLSLPSSFPSFFPLRAIFSSAPQLSPLLMMPTSSASSSSLQPWAPVYSSPRQFHLVTPISLHHLNGWDHIQLLLLFLNQHLSTLPRF